MSDRARGSTRASGVEVRGVTKSFGASRVLRAVDLDVGAGQTVALLGPSGCGKTTLLRCIAGLESPDQGVIKVGGKVLYSSERGLDVSPESRGLGFVFQSYAIWPHMTVFENVAYGLRIKRVPKKEIKERVERALELVGLQAMHDRHPGTLSGGQQQRVALARSIVPEPPLLLLDEPLSNLDAVIREEMREYLRLLIGELGLSAIFVTHDHSEALVLSDWIYVMSAGEIVEAGRPTDIYDRPKTIRGAMGIGPVNILPVRAVRTTSAGAAVATLESGSVELDVHDTDPGPPAAAATTGDPPRALMIRPSGVRLRAKGTTPSGTPNVFPVRIQHEFFLGSMHVYDVEWAGGTLRVEMPARDRIDDAVAEIVLDADVVRFVDA